MENNLKEKLEEVYDLLIDLKEQEPVQMFDYEMYSQMQLLIGAIQDDDIDSFIADLKSNLR